MTQQRGRRSGHFGMRVRTVLVPGRFGQALELSAHGGHLITDWPGVSGTAARTVMLWFKVSPDTDLTRNPAIVSWGDPTVPNGTWKLLLHQDSIRGPAVPRISFGDHGYDSPLGVNDGAWHHLSMSFSGRMGDDGHPELAIHVDGTNQPLTYRNFHFLYGVPAETAMARQPRTSTNSGASPLEIGRYSLARDSGGIEKTTKPVSNKGRYAPGFPWVGTFNQFPRCASKSARTIRFVLFPPIEFFPAAGG